MVSDIAVSPPMMTFFIDSLSFIQPVGKEKMMGAEANRATITPMATPSNPSLRELERGQEGDGRHGHRPDEVDQMDAAHARHYTKKGAPPPPLDRPKAAAYFFFRSTLPLKLFEDERRLALADGAADVAGRHPVGDRELEIAFDVPAERVGLEVEARAGRDGHAGRHRCGS